MESILMTVKKIVGVESSESHFDPDIILSVNSALFSLQQLGVGSGNGLFITGVEETWAALLGTRADLEAAKLFICLKVRLSFDPPSSAFVLTSMERQIAELEWRLNVQAEPTTVLEKEGESIDEHDLYDHDEDYYR